MEEVIKILPKYRVPVIKKGRGRKKTHEEYVNEVAVINPNVEVVEKYMGANTKIIHRCLIDDYEWCVTPHNILKGRGCPKCSKHIKKTHDDYVNEVSLINSNILVLGKYVNYSTPILHKCVVHDVEWYTAPCNILKGHGCRQCGNDILRKQKVKSHKEYVEDLKKINLNIIVLEEYVNANVPILHKCLIDDHEWIAKPNNILSGKGCPKCGGSMKKTHDEYVKEILFNNLDIEVLEEYINAYTPILHRCKTHGIEWKICPSNILQGNGCHECLKEKIKIKNTKTHKQYIEELKEITSKIIVLGTYITANTPILHKCLIDGYEWKAQPSNILSGNRCPQCAGNIKRTHEEYIQEVSIINSDIEVLEEYINANIPILHKCLIDGFIWNTRPSNILSGCGCPRCNESSGERQVRQWLEKNKINYIFQQTFDDCRDKKLLPFDFYLPDFNTIVEYDHKQHFEPIEYFGGKESFEKTVKHDNIKNEYCKNNGISLLRIPYFKNVEEELNNFLFI